MSYQVIARKWRPQAFDDVTGQEHITRTLRNAIEHDRLHHAYLFSGARGVGKTTTARLLAKALNCHKTPGPNTHPCQAGDPDACPSCVEISESRSIDVLEFDAASNTQVDKIRDLVLEGIQIAPARDRFKVFIIDEVHQLSNHSFNALLKTLEEPPKNVVFIMATTEPHKLPDTILSRCQQFEFRTIAAQKIFDRLKLIADAEKIDISDPALREIARSGDGSMRDAQSNFDQVISFSGDRIDVDDVTGALGLAGAEMLTRVASGIVKKDAAALLGVVSDLIARGHDLRNFCRDLLGLFRDLLVYKLSDGDAALVEGSPVEAGELKTLADSVSEADLLRFFNALADTETKLRDAAQPRFVLEMGLVRLIELQRVVPVDKLLARLADLERSLGQSESRPSMSTVPAGAEPAEKKTLKFAEQPVQPPAEPSFEPEEPPMAPLSIADLTAPFVEDVPSSDPAPAAVISSLPVKLPPIAAEELEHVDDTWLDNAYEEKLFRLGDNLAPIANASKLIAAAIGAATGGSNGHSAASPAPLPMPDTAKFVPPALESDEGDAVIPTLPPDPTDADLIAFAEAHPHVKRVMRIFRAKIVEVRPRPSNGQA